MHTHIYTRARTYIRALTVIHHNTTHAASQIIVTQSRAHIHRRTHIITITITITHAITHGRSLFGIFRATYHTAAAKSKGRGALLDSIRGFGGGLKKVQTVDKSKPKV